MSNTNHSDRSDVRVSTSGGVTRVEYGVETPAPQQANPQPVVPFSNDGATRSFGSDGAATVRGFQRVSGAEIRAEAHGGQGVLATASDMNLKPSTTVTLPGGVEVNLEMAERFGYVHRDASGRYIEGRAGGEQAQPQAQPQPKAPQPQKSAEAGDVDGMQPASFGADHEAALAHMVKGVDPAVVNDALVEAANLLARNGSLDGFKMDDFVSLSGLRRDQAEGFLTAAVTMLSSQADSVLSQHGVEDPEQFLAWAMQERPSDLQRAFLYHASVRDVSTYKALAREYIRAVHPTEEGLKQAGFETMRDQKGDVLVKWNGLWTSASALAKQGRI